MIAPADSDAAKAVFAFSVACSDNGPLGLQNGIALGDGDEFHLDEVPIGSDCFVAEHLPGDQWVVTGWLNGNDVPLVLTEGGYIGVPFVSTGEDSVVITNCYVGDPYFTECRPSFGTQ